ncbi:MAG: SGNH/GDSL hydrolase family protein [Anaerolineales bacterium]|nr:SGNH/GDSL hydrolase family protein [Anaerolineales bacterium]
MKQKFSLLLILSILFSACAFTPTPLAATATYSLSIQSSPTPLPHTSTPESAETDAAPPIETYTPGPVYTPTEDTRLAAKYWRQWPIVPELSANAIRILQEGIAAGNDPRTFSKLGDCQSETDVFLGIYETDRYYFNESNTYLQEAIDFYEGSFSWESAAVVDGLSVTSAFSPLWADPEKCLGTESPIECEVRLHNPSVMLISLGTNWKPGAEISYEENLRKIVDFCLERNILPVLATKADNVEGDHAINEITAQIAYDYDIPLWNFWAAVQYLPSHGLDQNREDSANYLIPDAWNEKSFTALQTLYVISKEAE